MAPKKSQARKRKQKDDDDNDDDDEYLDIDQDDFDYDIKQKKGSNSSSSSSSSSKKFGKDMISSSSSSLLPYQDCSTSLTLKKDHEKRPIWITRDNRIILEAFSPYYQQAYDFLIDISEPETRPELIHTYVLTEDSLYSAVAVARSTESIIKQLNIFCKTEIPDEVVRYIRECTDTFGKAKLVLRDNNFYVESLYPDVLRELLRNPRIKEARAKEAESAVDSLTSSEFIESTVQNEKAENRMFARLDDDEEDDDVDIEGNNNSLKTVSFMIAPDRVQKVKQFAKEESHYPLLEEYDYSKDHKNPKLIMEQRPSTKIRPYQVRSLSKMFGNNRARSGIIVLPCGAGKSLTGVMAATTIKRSTVVMCINNASVLQWKEQFTLWTTVSDKCIKVFTSATKEQLPPPSEACIVITTYSMASRGGKRSESGELMMRSIKEREWGLLILDEVHVAPADNFQKVLDIVNAHCKLGLTATLVREDTKIKNLNFLIGPKLYEANWIDLTNQGYLARAQCVEVWCPMTAEFYREYILRGKETLDRIQKLLYLLNPRKVKTCEYLVKEHSKRNHKIIIFSDDVPALKFYCEALSRGDHLKVPFIYGGTSQDERLKYLTAFKHSSISNVIGLSQVGDTALDIPEANVVIQVSSHFGARRQEAQRLGRILRPKPNPSGGYNAFFYTLVSNDTREMKYCTKRQQYLVDQGYTFKVEQLLADKADRESTLFADKSDELLLLNQVLAFNCKDYDEVENKYIRSQARGEEDDDGQQQTATVKRRATNMAGLSGADGLLYTEYDA